MAKKMMLLDWRAMKYYHIRVLLLPVFTVMIGLALSPLLIMPTSVMMFVFFSINPFTVEEKGELNNLYLTLPVSRTDIVAGRYLLAGLMALCGVVMSIPLTFLVNRFGSSHFYIPMSWYVFIFALSLFLFALFNLAIYPILFKLGYSKGKFWGIVLPAVLLGIVFGFFTWLSYLSGNQMLALDILEYAYNHMLPVSGGLSLLGIILIIVSYNLSRRIYAKRDL